MNFRLRQETALDLTLEGSVGSFRVGSGTSGPSSLEVKYLLTHVGLNFATSSNDKLLSALAPVREVFDAASLDFDEIMQRDIDDARVSSELVPYLLDDQSKDMVKLFPPIVIVAMPIQEGRKRPDSKYPVVTEMISPPDKDREHEVRIIRSGSVGKEVFEFEQPLLDGEPIVHDFVRLRLNTARTKLVIVDGQHRAMALLAIYRNLKDGWTDELRAPFREYYSAWTPNFINQFNLREINLPVIICTIPELDENYSGDFDMKRAARSIFLTLNKTARQVSDARNKLLDDNDIISALMRRTLSEIKQRDRLSPGAMRIENIELDQDGNKQKIQTPVAITGVPHIYYIIEHMMLDNGSAVEGIRPRSGNFSIRTKMHDLLERLDGRNILGAAAADAVRRDLFSSKQVDQLGRQFDVQYGATIVKAFDRFAPYDRHNRAVLALGEQLEAEQDRQLRPILLNGQGIGRVFEAHRQNLKQKLQDKYFKTDVPEIEASAVRLNATAQRIDTAIRRFRQDRAARYFVDFSDKKVVRQDDGSVVPRAVEWLNRLYDDVLTSIAFQTALICGFLMLVEKAERKTALLVGEPPVDREQAFDEYITQLNQFFIPRTPSQLKKMLRVFTGEVAEDREIWQTIPSNQTFRNVVFRSEMQPDQWPKYRYLLLEVWKPSHSALKLVTEEDRALCRGEVFSALHEHHRTQFCLEKQKLADDLSPEERKQIFDQAFDQFSSLLKNLGGETLDRKAMKEASSVVSATASTEPDGDVNLNPNE